MLDSFYTAFIEEQRYLLYLDGLKMTILVSVIAIIIGVVLGTLLALMRLTAEQKGKSTLLSKIAYVYIDIIRGTPTLTQLMIMYFVILKGQSGLLVGSLTFGLNSAAYVAEIIRAGIQAVDQGQMEGGKGKSMSWGMAVGLMPLPGELFTEIEAIKQLANVECFQIGAGGIGDAQGSITLEIWPSTDKDYDKIIDVLKEVKSKNREISGMKESLIECEAICSNCKRHIGCGYKSQVL